jgi:hypothetical protein
MYATQVTGFETARPEIKNRPTGQPTPNLKLVTAMITASEGKSKKAKSGK